VATEPVVSTSVVAAPKDYDIPQAQEILLLSVEAEFMDNGAAVDWLPAVQVLDNNGNVLATAADQGVKVTAGDDASVTWFPGVKHAAAAAPAGSSFVPICAGRLTHSQTVNAGATKDIAWDTVTIPANSAGDFTWSNVTPSRIGVTHTGTLLYALSIERFDDWPAYASGVIQFYGNMTHAQTSDVQVINASYNPVLVFDDSSLATAPSPVVTSMGICVGQTNTGNWQATITNTTAANWRMAASGTAFVLARVNDAISV